MEPVNGRGDGGGGGCTDAQTPGSSTERELGGE